MTLEDFETVIKVGDKASIMSKTDSFNWCHFPSVIYCEIKEGLLIFTVNSPKSLCRCEISLDSISEVLFKNNAKFVFIKD